MNRVKEVLTQLASMSYETPDAEFDAAGFIQKAEAISREREGLFKTLKTELAPGEAVDSDTLDLVQRVIERDREWQLELKRARTFVAERIHQIRNLRNNFAPQSRPQITKIAV